MEIFMPTNMIKAFRRVSLPLVVATIFGSGLYQGSAYAALPATPCTGTGTVTCNLWAKPQPVTTLTTGVSVTVWGYTDTPSGTPTLPGPVLIVNQGDVVTVNLTNNLPEPTGLLFQGQSLPPGSAAGCHADCLLISRRRSRQSHGTPVTNRSKN